MSEKEPITYRDAGVDIDAASSAISAARSLIEATQGSECLGGIGGFGGLFRIGTTGLDDPVLVASTDSVGTKVKVAALSNRHEGVGRDIVNHCVNDILVQGARPLFFLDYIGIGKVEASVMAEILTGLASACRENGCALLGGETAEMPDLYAPGEYDLVGTVVGVVDGSRILDGSRVRVGDRILGLCSTGMHTNGFTLARKILLEREGLAPDTVLPELGGSVADALLAVHKSYAPALLPLVGDGLVNALAHITGGGLVDNLPRVLPEGTGAVIRKGTWTVPAIFEVLARLGPVAEDECYRAFNMGLGMLVVVGPDQEDKVRRRLAEAGEAAPTVGEIVAGERRVEIFRAS